MLAGYQLNRGFSTQSSSGKPVLHFNGTLGRTIPSLTRPPGRKQFTCRAAKRSLYEVLDVPQKATSKEIKTAYRKKALKLHPDVNPAADAKDRFMEAKAAFETLVDDGKRSEYDRRLRLGFDMDGSGFGSGFGTGSGPVGPSSGYGAQKGRPAPPKEDNYTFEDLMRDLDKEISDWAKTKASKPGDAPKSLWDELEMVGEEFVDFLETSIGLSPEEVKKQKQQNGSQQAGASSASGSSSSSRGSESTSGSSPTNSGGSYTDYTGKDWYKKYEDVAPTQGQAAARKEPAAKPPPPKPKTADIDEELAALKRKFKKM